MQLFITLEIQSGQDVCRTLECASFLCKVVILSMTDEEELAAPVLLTQFPQTVRDNETLVQIPCNTDFSNNMLDGGQQQCCIESLL